MSFHIFSFVHSERCAISADLKIPTSLNTSPVFDNTKTQTTVVGRIKYAMINQKITTLACYLLFRFLLSENQQWVETRKSMLDLGLFFLGGKRLFPFNRNLKVSKFSKPASIFTIQISLPTSIFIKMSVHS